MAYKITICPKCNEGSQFWGGRKICARCKAAEEFLPDQVAKRSAWSIVTRAIKRGDLMRQPCVACVKYGLMQRGTSQAHHEDYTAPLDVRWLCRSHHKQHHNEFGPGKNASRAEATQ